MGRKLEVSLSAEEEIALRSLLSDPKTSYRASIVLQAAEGRSARQIAERLKMGRDNVRRWITAFTKEGVAGLSVRRSGGRPTVVDPNVRDLILSLSPEWSVRTIAKRCGVSPSTVQRVIEAERVIHGKPQPDLIAKKQAAIDMDAQIQALLKRLFGPDD